MKKIVLVLSLIFINESFACGGCRDSYLGNLLANQNISKFNQEVNQIASVIESLNNQIQNKILKSEEEVLKEKQILSNLKQNNLLNFKNINFTISKQNYIQNIINSSKAQ